MTETPIRALVVADAAGDLVAVLELDADIAVTGRAASAVDALGYVDRSRPDIVVVDLSLADGSAHQAIEQIMDQIPTPILVLSPRIQDRHSPSAVQALVAGALDALPTPPRWEPAQGVELRANVRRLSKARVIRHLRGRAKAAPPPRTVARTRQQPVVAMAASAGGPEALAGLLAELGELPAPVLVVQHLHPDFTGGLLDWMCRVSALPVEIATDRRIAEPGRVYLAPGGAHLRLGPGRRLELDPEPVTIHRPSADELFGSVAAQSGPAAVGVVLTGMGDDGARGLLAIHDRGGRTFAQDEVSSAVFGMPRAAQQIGAVSELTPLRQLATEIQHAVQVLARVQT
jgi:two-component system chemotaxis response regulator CheB